MPNITMNTPRLDAIRNNLFEYRPNKTVTSNIMIVINIIEELINTESNKIIDKYTIKSERFSYCLESMNLLYIVIISIPENKYLIR